MYDFGSLELDPTSPRSPACTTFPQVACMYDFGSLHLDLELVLAYCVKTQSQFHACVKFHSCELAIHILQSMSVILLSGGLIDILETHHLFVLYFSSMRLYAGGFGLMSDFLVKLKHPLAFRYNDSNVLQQHCLAESFSLLADPELNFFVHSSQDQVRGIRKLLIDVTLRTGLEKSLQETSMFRTKFLSGDSADRPEGPSEADIAEDYDSLVVLLSTTLKVAENSWVARPVSKGI